MGELRATSSIRTSANGARLAGVLYNTDQLYYGARLDQRFSARIGTVRSGNRYRKCSVLRGQAFDTWDVGLYFLQYLATRPSSARPGWTHRPRQKRNLSFIGSRVYTCGWPLDDGVAIP